MKKIGMKKYPGTPGDEAFARVHRTIIKHGGPKLHAATVARTDGVYSKLLDHSRYTGSHRERFDHAGAGRGKAGRTGHGTGAVVSDLSQITRPGMR